MRSSSEMSGKMWTFAVGSLLRAFFLALIYPKGYKGDSPAGEGFKFGLYIGLLFGLPTAFFSWGGAPITYQYAIYDGAATMIMFLLAGIITGLIYGKIVKPAAA